MSDHEITINSFPYFSSGTVHVAVCSCGEYQSGKQIRLKDAESFGLAHATAKTLWAVHIGGSDDLVACPDREAADRLKDGIDKADAWQRERLGTDYPMIALLAARVVPWPYSSEAHAAQLVNRDPHRSREPSTVQPGSDTFPDATDG